MYAQLGTSTMSVHIHVVQKMACLPKTTLASLGIYQKHHRIGWFQRLVWCIRVPC